MVHHFKQREDSAARAKARSKMLLVAVVSALGLCFNSSAEIQKSTVRVEARDHTAIQRAIDQLPSGGGTVVIVAVDNPIEIGATIVIDRNNVTLAGEGRVELRLSDGANMPVIIAGQTLAVPLVTRTNIHIRNLIINGNRTRQTSELNPANLELRNNGISLRRITDSSVEEVVAFACRSGGLVTELGCRRIVVRKFEAYDNHFDGLACYETEKSLFTDLNLHNNLAAGVSLDIRFVGNVIQDSKLSSNRTVGVFVRDSRNNSFNDLHIHSSAEHGFFLAQVDYDNATPAVGNQFNRCRVTKSGGAAIRINNDTCVDNTAVSCVFENNGAGGVSETSRGLLRYGPPL